LRKLDEAETDKCDPVVEKFRRFAKNRDVRKQLALTIEKVSTIRMLGSA